MKRKERKELERKERIERKRYEHPFVDFLDEKPKLGEKYYRTEYINCYSSGFIGWICFKNNPEAIAKNLINGKFGYYTGDGLEDFGDLKIEIDDKTQEIKQLFIKKHSFDCRNKFYKIKTKYEIREEKLEQDIRNSIKQKLNLTEEELNYIKNK